jgi:membrane dipeptidase
MNHIDYIKNLVGDEFVALGTDFDGIRSVPLGLEDAGKLNKLKELMDNKGYQTQEIENIFYKNAFRVLDDVLD